MNTKINFQSYPFYLFVLGLYFVITAPFLFSKGMFMDGMMYTTIANNLSNDIGTFWVPQFTKTCHLEFYEHPPLALGIQSVFFKLFGNGWWVDKLYSFSTLLVQAFLISRIWKSLALKNAWFPILLWSITPVVYWASTNNMLENTLSIFILLSIWFYLLSWKNKSLIWVILAGMMLSLAFLTKGFVAFFPWTFPFIYWLILKKYGIGKMMVDTFLIVVATLLPLLLLVLLNETARMSLEHYFNQQVVRSLQGMVTVESRFFILKRLSTELIPMFIASSLLIVTAKIRKEKYEKELVLMRFGWMFLLLALTGVLPILISLKQSGFYILATYPLFAMSISLFLYPFIAKLFTEKLIQSDQFRWFRYFSWIFVLVGLFLVVSNATKVGRDKDEIHDVELMLPLIAEDEIIYAEPVIENNWTLQAYFYRFKRISLDIHDSPKYRFLIVEKSNNFVPDKKYEKLNLATKRFDLYQSVTEQN